MAKLDAKQRKALPKSDFAVPSKAPGSGSYPINDPSHARNALARVAQHGSPAEQAAVKAKVHAKYPGIGKPSAGRPLNEREPAREAAAERRNPSLERRESPAQDRREMSRPFQPPRDMQGGPAAPSKSQTVSRAPDLRESRAPSRSPNPQRDGVSGLDRAMSAHADKVHPHGR